MEHFFFCFHGVGALVARVDVHWLLLETKVRKREIELQMALETGWRKIESKRTSLLPGSVGKLYGGESLSNYSEETRLFCYWYKHC